MSSHDQALSHAWYWDERYKQSDGSSDPTHEWFRSFADLEPFFGSNLFTAPGLTGPEDPLVLHLGSGDSVRCFLPTLPPCSGPHVHHTH
jgi:hypothetical protein